MSGGARYPPLQGEHRADVLVVGAGLAGCAAALDLVRRGRSVVVLEGGTIGAASSPLGHLAIGPSMPYQAAVHRFGRAAARELWETYREGHERIRGVLAAIGRDCGHHGDGGFLLARDREEGAALADSEDLLREDGFPGEFLDNYMLEARLDVRGFAAAYWAADDAVVDTCALVQGMAALAASQGVAMHEASPVARLDLGAAGVLAETATGRVRAERALIAGETAALPLVPFFAGRLQAAAGECSLFSKAEGSRLPSPARTVGGIAWRDEGDVLAFFRPRVATASPSHSGHAPAEEFLQTHLPYVSPEPRESASLVAAVSFDGLPLVGPLPGLAAVAACGFGWLGDSLALVTAGWAAEALATLRDPTPPWFRADRAGPPPAARA